MGSYLSYNSGIIMNESEHDVFCLIHEKNSNPYKQIAEEVIKAKPKLT
jgi:hypothetical protein